MSLIRAPVRAWFSRWGETTISASVGLIGLWLLWRGHARFDWLREAIGLALALIGAAAFWASLQRARFRGSAGGPGLVEVTERQITYLTSFGGASIDLEAMTRLEIRTTLGAGRVWVLKQSEGPTVFIPLDASGSQKLFDAFSALSGIEAKKLIAAAHSHSDHRSVIWRGKPGYRPLT